MTLTLLILIVFVLVLGVAGAAAFYAVRQHRQQETRLQEQAREFLDRQSHAAWATASLLSVSGGIIGSEHGVSNWARYELSLRVAPPEGEPYTARTAWLVEVARMSSLQPGQEIQVRIDLQDRQIIYPGADWARYIPK
jgi:hypothetical protein